MLVILFYGLLAAGALAIGIYILRVLTSKRDP